MTSPGLKMKAKIVLEDLGLHPLIGETGEIEIKETLSIQHYNTLQETLRKSDFELVTGKEMILIEKIRYIVIEMIHCSDELPNIKYSDYISKRLGANYTYLS